LRRPNFEAIIKVAALTETAHRLAAVAFQHNAVVVLPPVHFVKGPAVRLIKDVSNVAAAINGKLRALIAVLGIDCVVDNYVPRGRLRILWLVSNGDLVLSLLISPVDGFTHQLIEEDQQQS
jgi:hypothetical protein